MTSELLAAKLFADPERVAVGDVVVLSASYCGTCDRYEFPILTDCPECGGPATSAELSTSGTIESRTAVLHTPPGSLIEAPYAVVTASFPEGITVLSLLTDASYDEIAVGDKVDTVGVDIGGRVGFAFKLTPSNK